MENIKSIVAKNISELRQSNNMTQLELAEKINYSDKAISKWERAESCPDITVLVQIAELFGVTVDYLVKEESSVRTISKSKPEETKYNRKVITYISESVAWIVAIIAFIITTLIVKRMTFQFLYFVYALPVVMIVKLVFNFLTEEGLMLESEGRYYPKDKFKALIENYFDHYKGRLYEILRGEEDNATH